jgi:hypothetical protein
MRTQCLLISAALASLALGGFSSELPRTSAQDPVSTASQPGQVTATMDDAVAAYRKVIVLMDGAAALDEGNRERVRTAAWILFEGNGDRLANLEEDLRADLGR